MQDLDLQGVDSQELNQALALSLAESSAGARAAEAKPSTHPNAARSAGSQHTVAQEPDSLALCDKARQPASDPESSSASAAMGANQSQTTALPGRIDPKSGVQQPSSSQTLAESRELPGDQRQGLQSGSANNAPARREGDKRQESLQGLQSPASPSVVQMQPDASVQTAEQLESTLKGLEERHAGEPSLASSQAADHRLTASQSPAEGHLERPEASDEASSSGVQNSCTPS